MGLLIAADGPWALWSVNADSNIGYRLPSNAHCKAHLTWHSASGCLWPTCTSCLACASSAPFSTLNLFHARNTQLLVQTCFASFGGGVCIEHAPLTIALVRCSYPSSPVHCVPGYTLANILLADCSGTCFIQVRSIGALCRILRPRSYQTTSTATCHVSPRR